MESNIVIKENLTLTNEKIKSMCRLNFEDNDFLFTTENGKSIVLDKKKNTIYSEGNNTTIKLDKYIEYLQNVQEKREKKVILTTLSPNTHRTSEENLGLSYLAAVLRKNGYNVEIIDGWLEDLKDEEVLKK